MNRRLIFASIALFVFVLGARWTLVARYGMALPDMDQWDAEARQMIGPWFEGGHSLANVFRAHNEHRIAPTRLVALGLTILNRQWDQRLEAVVNAFLPATIAALLLLFAGRCLGGPATAWVGLLLAIAYSGYFSWENAIHGFHSQQWYLILFALGAIRWLPLERPGSRLWWCGAACAALSLVAMGSGALAAVACAAVAAVRAWQGRRFARGVFLTLVLCLVLLALGAWTRVTVPGHEPLKAHSYSAFWWAALRGMGWPAFGSAWGYTALILWLPWFWLVARMLRRTQAVTSCEWTLFGVGAWVLLQIAAMAYARGGSAPPPAPRYIDNFFLGLVTNAICLGRLASSLPAPPDWRRLFRIVAAAWIALLAGGLVHQLRAVVPGQLQDFPRFDYYAETNVRDYIATGDAHFLQHREIPYPDANSLAGALRIRSVRDRLPSTVRAPLTLPVAHEIGFVTRDSRAPQGSPPYPRKADGLSPATPPLENARFHGCYAAAVIPARWDSAPVHAVVRGWLQFLVAGDLGRRGTSLVLLDARTGRLISHVAPDKVPGESWHNAFVRAPAVPFVVQASETAPGGWFAFADPIEMGRLSHWAWRATRRGPVVMGLGGACLIGVLLMIGVAAPKNKVISP